MAAPSLKYAALATLNLWLMTDASVHADLNSRSDEEKLAAIARGADRWGFDHKLEAKHDEGIGLARFQPALDLIEGLKLQDFENDPTITITKTAQMLSLRYGNSNVLSATTKLLWMKFRSPIIVYDANAELALGTNHLRKFYDQWHARYAVYKADILNACNSLQDVLEYVCDPAIASAEFVRDLAAESWFQQRVFGTYLTKIGRSARYPRNERKSRWSVLVAKMSTHATSLFPPLPDETRRNRFHPNCFDQLDESILITKNN